MPYSLPLRPLPARPRRNRAALALPACLCLALCSVFAQAGGRQEDKGKRRQGEGNTVVANFQSTIHNPQSTIHNDVRIETFAPERGYIVGVESVVLLCVVRNLGSAPLAENQLRLRCYPISGLDYTNGNLLPVLPALAPGQAVAYRWRFAPADARAALIAGVVLEKTEEEKRRKGETVGAQFIAPNAQPATPNAQPATPNAQPATPNAQPATPNAQPATPNAQPATPNAQPATPNAQPATPNAQPATPDTIHNPQSAIGNPQLAFAVVPRLPRLLALGDVPVLKDPLAHAGALNGTALLLNSRVAMRAQTSDRKEPSLVLGVRDGAGWRNIANCVSPLRVCVAEDGQLPWWQAFRCQQMRAYEDKTSALLTLTGNVGTACRAEITFESHPDTGVLNGKIRLTALRPLRLSGMQMPALLTASDDKTLTAPRADGAPFLLPEPPALLPEDARLAAGHNGAATFGMSWPADPPFPGWKWDRLPLADGLYTSVLGAQATNEAQSSTLSAGSSLEISFRWFAFAPSDTIRDATRFQIP